MVTYKIVLENRNYNSWNIYDSNNFEKKDLQINPLESKLFSNDVFTFEKNTVNIIHSSVRTGPTIAGVLIISGNKTYGRKNGKLLYKCMPDDIRIPAFLIPYEIKNVGFSKIFTNLYVTFSFNEWGEKHPCGKLNSVIGPVDALDNFYEYQLYCKSLNVSLQKFQKDTSKSIQNRSNQVFIENIKEKYKNIEDRTNQKEWHVFSIDPEKCLDFDDAFSVRKTADNAYIVSVYIANVSIWIDALSLWDSFSKRVSTIYLPDKRRPMIPTILSEGLCSLQENVTRIALTMDLYVVDNEIVDIKYCNSFIKVHKNYVYEEDKLLQDEHYHELLDVVQNLSTKFKYISNIKDSHDIVTYLMILMNYQCAMELLKHNTGIFRSAIGKITNNTNNSCLSLPSHLPNEVINFVKLWNTTAGQYINGSELSNGQQTRHEVLDIEAYIHITSPIRRLVDLLNMIQLQKVLGLVSLCKKVNEFYDKWLHDLEYINTTMRCIRKIQIDCSLLDLCNNKPELLNKEYDGYIFDKIVRHDGLYQYIVFLPDLKMNSRITIRENMENYDMRKFQLYLFNNEEKFKKKIRLQLL
uniref:RNB domain-containing protein n=1 Tax=viral metagenome TaxID=1070528 RepID=A0A6C0JKN8_9ZZZZ